jgi:uncharacterized protein (UPF0333 family)
MTKNNVIFFSNKKGDESLFQNLIPIILVIVFIIGAMYGINRFGSQATIYEQVYAKQIALAIDKAKPGTNITIDITKLYQVAEKNRFPYNSMMQINNKEKYVWVRVIAGKGYKYYFYNNAQIIWSFTNDERLYMSVK